MNNLAKSLSNFNKSKDIKVFDDLLEKYPSDLKKAIISTIQGDSYSIYEYIFSLDCSYKEEFCWLGWVNSVEGKNIVWTVCKFDPLYEYYYNSMRNFLNKMSENIPKRAIFLDPLVISD